MVGKEELSDLSGTWERRTPQDITDVLNEASDLLYKKDREALLKEHSLRYGQNAFMKLANSDPFAAVSFDDLHFEDSGMWGAHLFPLLKDHFEALGRGVQ
ncbi:hypothetical protein V5O48_019599, partial [Marasmius crinis-equi]